MNRQALYRIEWNDATNPDRAPPGLAVKRGPWGCDATAELVYEGPQGRTTVTVEAVIEPDNSEPIGAIGLG